LSAALAQAPGGAVLEKAAAWQTPDFETLRAGVFDWLDARQPDASLRARAEALWKSPPGAADAGLLDQLAETFALVDPEAARLVDLCKGPCPLPSPPGFAWLSDPKTSLFEANNLRLVYGRWLAGERLYDESRDQLSGLRPEDVVDPAALLFYQAVVAHRLLDRDGAIDAIGRLLNGARSSPERYVAVARLMKADLKDLEEDTLDHIARRMEDVGRRLDLGRAGPNVRRIEDGVVESLDKLIKELQDQQQKAGGGGGNGAQSSSPAQDSRILGGRGPGDVTKRNVGGESGWGNLPPKEREKAMQEIGREFPSHYRDAIEQYFRKLAGQGSDGE
jgi:hypothetical protein